MIILYGTTETKFTSNGLGVLDHDIINPVIEESANGTFKLSFDYPLSGICGNRIGRRMYVKADDPDVEGNIFKIYNLEKNDGILSVVAFQVANEFNNNWIEHTNIMGKNGQSALDQMKSNLTNSTRFNFFSDITTTANSEVVRLNPLTWLIDSSTDNSFVNRWGGEIKRDGFNIRMFKQRGSDNGVQIRWRKNLSSYNVKWDDTTVVTRIRPVGYNGLTLPELYVDSPKLANYGDPIIKEVKYDDIKVADENSSSDDNAYKTVDEAYAALRNAAAKEFSESHLDDPTVTADVSMISLKNTREYADVAELETIKPWDTIQLINERDNVDIQMRLNSYKYNPLNHEFTELKFVSANQALTSGNTSLSSVINGISSTVQSVSDTANQAQIAANGKNAINRGAEDPNHLTFNGTLTDGDIYYRQNGDKKEMWIYSAKEKAWKLEVGDMTAQEIADEVAQGKKDADQMRKDTEARFEKAEESLASISDDMSKTEDDLKSVDAKFDSKTDTLNQSIVQAKSDISDQVDQLKTVKSTADSALKKANGNDSSISTINQNIDKINGKFDLTATKTDIDTVNKKYTQQQAQIDANTKGITLKASQDSVNTLSQTVTSNSSSLSVLSNEVKQKTSKTDFDTLTGRVTNAEQKIDATAEDVTSTVSKVEGLQTQVDNSAVGTNLLKNTQDWNTSAWEYSSTSHSLGGDVLTVDARSSDSSIDVAQFVNNISPSTQYTLGWNLQFQSSTDKRLTLYVVEYKDKNNVTSNYQDHNFPLVASYNTTDRKGMAFTTQPDCAAVKVFVRTQAGTKNSIRRLKLEKGTKATDWSANPADNATVTALNVVKQTADETYEGLFNKDGSNKIDVTAQGLKAQIETAKESAQGYAKTTIDTKAGEFNASLSSVQTTLQNDATNKANNALNNAKSYANSKATALQTDYDNKISNTSKEFTEKWTAVTKQVQDSAVGANLLTGTNILDTSNWVWDSSLVSFSNGLLLYQAKNIASGSYTDVGHILTSVDSSTQYTLSWSLSYQGSPMALYVVEYKDRNNVTASYQDHYLSLSGNYNTTARKSMTFTTQPDCKYVKLLVRCFAGSDHSDMHINFKLETGSNATPWCLNFDELATQSYAETLVDATAGTLQTKVNGADYHNLISMNSNGILLDAHGVNNSNKNIILSGDHIKMDSSNPVTIPNAAITELDAGKLKVGSTLNAANVNLINLNADHISSGTLTGVSFHQSSSGHNTWIDGNGVHDYDNHGNNTWIQKGNIQVYDNAGQGMFMQGGKLVLSNLDVWGTIASMSTGAKPPVDDYGVIEHGVGMGLGGIKIHGGGGSALLTDNTGKQASVVDVGYYGIVDGGGVSASWNLAMLGGDQDWCAAIKAGKNYGNYIADQPSVLVGTADWSGYTGSTSTPGQNVVVKANGIWLYSIGETHIDASKLTINAGIRTSQGLQVDGEWTQVKSLHVLNSFVNSSLLSRKTNISKLNTETVRDEIRKAEIYRYQYKDEVENGSSSYHDSVIIDDVNDVSQYYVPDDWVSNDRKGRDDGNAIGYAIVAIQDLYQQNEELKTQLDTMQNEISELKKIIKQK